MNKRDLKDYEQKYNSKDHYDFEKIQIKYRRKNILIHLNKNLHSSILEVGCGMEPLFCYIDDYKEFTVIEPSSKFYNKAVSLKGNDKRIVIHNEYIENSNLNKKYDLIVLSSLLHEIENIENLLNIIKKLCHSETIIYVNVPNAKSFHRLLAFESKIISSIYEKSNNQIKFQQNRIFTISTLKKLIESSGFNVLESGSYFIKPFTHEQMRKLVSLKIITEDICKGLDQMIRYFPYNGSEIFVTFKLN